MRLSNEERAKVRKVITSHPLWPDYRARQGITAADLTSAACIEVCDALGIDLTAAVRGENVTARSDTIDHVIAGEATQTETPPVAEPVTAPVADGDAANVNRSKPTGALWTGSTAS